MIISRTPFRVSFFGGGTDYPVWYRQHGGAVLATSIDKYCYITCRYLPPFFDHKSRIVYSRIESVKLLDEIEHPTVRETLKFLDIRQGVEIHHDGDLPARTGLGSSSAFTVGLLHALYALKHIMPTRMQLACEAIHVERDLVSESVGSQDQVSASIGGLNKISFKSNDEIVPSPVIVEPSRLNEFQEHLMLFFTGFSRHASEIARCQVENTHRKKSELSSMLGMVDHALDILTGASSLDDFGKLLHEAWLLKRGLTDKISNSTIDHIYQTATRAGALGGKLLGAGGGGFMLLFARPELHHRIKLALKHLVLVPFKIENYGSQIIFYDYSMNERHIHHRRVQEEMEKLRNGELECAGKE